MSSKQLHILMADDDLEDLELMEDAFTGMKTEEVKLHKLENGSQVLGYLNALPDAELPCLIIIDYNMPGMKGSEVLSQLCRMDRYKPIPKVILSTSNAKLHVEECLRSGATDYFVKPNNLTEVTQLAAKMLSICRAA